MKWAILVSVVVAFGWLWLHEHDERVRQTALASQRAEELKDMSEKIDRLTRSMEQQDSIIKEQIESNSVQQRRIAEHQAAIAKTTGDRAAQLRALLTAENQRLLDSVVAGFQQQLVLAQQKWERENDLVKLKDIQIAARDSIIAEQNLALNKAVSSYANLAGTVSHRSFGAKVVGFIPWLIAAAAFFK